MYTDLDLLVDQVVAILEGVCFVGRKEQKGRSLRALDGAHVVKLHVWFPFLHPVEAKTPTGDSTWSGVSTKLYHYKIPLAVSFFHSMFHSVRFPRCPLVQARTFVFRLSPSASHPIGQCPYVSTSMMCGLPSFVAYLFFLHARLPSPFTVGVGLSSVVARSPRPTPDDG